jgi:murein DD-endopeptidase MepM/ murein hydrolase activator NlpD
MLHVRQSSAVVGVTDVVALGDPLAEVGNSGYSSVPHLHLEINEAGAGLGASIRGVELENVSVSLNPIVDDPWERRCASWEIRGGFLVEALPPATPSVPLLGAVGIPVLVGSILGVGWWETRRRNLRAHPR